MNKKNKIIIGVVIAIILVLIIAYIGKGYTNKDGNLVYVQKVSDIMGLNINGIDRYSGVVEAQDSVEIKKDSDKSVEEIYVSVGDKVVEGTPLFKYDNSQKENEIAYVKLEIDGIDSDIEALRQNIKDEKESDQDATIITNNIKAYEAEIRQKKYDLQLAEIKLNNLYKEIENATVTSKTSGVIKAINENDVDSSGNQVAFIEISQSGDYRIKATIDEKGVSNIAAGQEVIVRSRIDENKVWAGKISKIVTTPEENQTNDMYGFGSEQGERMSKYPFYVELSASEGLILGTHVFVEPNYGQTKQKEGIYLDSSYVVLEDDVAYVWGANKNNKLTKIQVEIGALNEETFEYQILSGLTLEDRITWPMEDYKEGMKVTDIGSIDEGK